MQVEQLTEQQAQDEWDTLAKNREEGLDAGASLPPADEAIVEPEPEVKAVEDSPPAEPADPFGSLPQAVKDKLALVDQLLDTTNQLKRHVGTAEGRVAAMQRELDVSKNAAKAASVAPSGGQIQAAQVSPEKWETLKQDFPEWAEATEALLNARIAGLTPQQAQGMTTEDVNTLVQQRTQEIEAKALRAVEEARIEARHEDWQDVLGSKEFADWFLKQPPETQALANSTKSRDVINVLNDWKKAKATDVEAIKQGRTARLGAAVTAKPGAAAPTKTVDQMSPDELWNYEARLAEKRRGNTGLTY